MVQLNKLIWAVGVAAAVLAPKWATAEPTSGDFLAEHGFYSLGSCRTLAATGRAIGAGPELTLADSTLGGCYGALGMDWNPSTGVLTVNGVEGVSAGSTGANYPFISLSISNLLFSMGEQITGISLVSQDLFTTVNNTDRFDPAPALSFTANSIDIDWLVTSGNDSLQMSIRQGGIATFQITTDAVIPEPSSLLLVGGALLALNSLRRRH